VTLILALDFGGLRSARASSSCSRESQPCHNAPDIEPIAISNATKSARITRRGLSGVINTSGGRSYDTELVVFNHDFSGSGQLTRRLISVVLHTICMGSKFPKWTLK
jgi:hypothetical protein